MAAGEYIAGGQSDLDLERGEVVYMRVGKEKAVPAWSLRFRYDYVLNGEAVPVEGHLNYVHLFISAVDGKLLDP